jgi:HD-GYP domain-containing protein (c-di-GMP phosphodiesterase class II)
VEDELHRRVDELSALYQTTLDIINVQDLPDLLNTIVMRAVDLLDGIGGGLYLCDPQQRQVRCVVSYKTQKDYTGTVLAYGEGAAGTVAATGEPLIIDDYQTWEGRAKAFENSRTFSAVISMPMLWHSQVIGVIHVLHDTLQHKFTEDDLTLLTSFANQAAVVVENARLFEETQRRLERLSALRSIDQVIASSLDLRVTLDILLGQILQLLEVDAASVLLYKPELQSLEFVAGQGFRTRTLQSTKLHLGNGFAGKAALEQRVVQVLDLNQLNTGFLRSMEFRNEEFVAYIGVPLIAKGNIIGVLEIYNREQFDPEDEWMDFLKTLAGQAAIAIDNIHLFNNLEMSNLELIQAYDATIEGWARALELRDMETEGHSRRVVNMTIALARRMGIEEEHLVHVRQGALLHDIGKMGVPDSVLQKSGSLTPDEWETIYQHPDYAYKWLSPTSYLKPALDIPYCHHEKWDGSGYPRGLKGERIPLAARIFAVVDVWDALTSDRPYRPAWDKKKALEYIKEQSGKHFDPKVVEAFLFMIINE